MNSSAYGSQASWQASDLRANLYKASRVEVPVEGKGFSDSAAPHDSEARGVHERVLALGSRAKPAPGIGFGGLIDTDNFRVRKCNQFVDEPHCCGVAGAPTKERPGLTDDVIRCDDPSNTARHDCSCKLVPAVPSRR